MRLDEYQNALAALPFGKRLPMAVYAYRGEGVSLGEELERLVAQVGIAFQTGAELNELKFRTDELKVSLLCEGIRASFGAAAVRPWGVILGSTPNEEPGRTAAHLR